MNLSVTIRHAMGGFLLDAAFESHGRLTAIFGPSGSGKTSVINVIAGLIRPDVARITLDGKTLIDTEQGVSVPVHRRGMGYVFQDARLFPHLTVRQNLGYGQWFNRAAARHAGMEAIVEMLDVGHLLQRKPHLLSGGEKQRVALGRALLQSPRMLLMDEPLASLDQARKQEILPYIERVRDEWRIPIVYVSHSLAEVSRLATDMVVLSRGHVVEAGSAEQVISHQGMAADDALPAGTLLTMTIAGYDAQQDLTTLVSTVGQALVPGRVAPEGTRMRLHISARDVLIATRRPLGLSALNVFAGRVTGLMPRGTSAIEVSVLCGDATVLSLITLQSSSALKLREGMQVYAVMKSLSVNPPGRAPLAGESN